MSDFQGQAGLDYAAERAEQLAESWLNGNKRWVLNELVYNEMPSNSLLGAILTLAVHQTLAGTPQGPEVAEQFWFQLEQEYRSLSL